MDSIPADKVLKRTQLDLQKRFPNIPCVSQMLGGPFLRGSAFLKNGLAFLQELDEVGKTVVDWQRGNFHCVLIQHLENLLNHSCNNFVLQFLYLASKFQNSILVLDESSSCHGVEGETSETSSILPFQ